MIKNNWSLPCQYHKGNLENRVYFQPYNNDVDYKIDIDKQPYCNSIYGEVYFIDFDSVTLSETSSYDGNRFLFNQTLTAELREGKNNTYFKELEKLIETEYRIIVKTKEGMYYVVNMEHPYTMTYNYEWSNSKHSCTIQFVSAQNMPTMKLNKLDNPIVKLIEKDCGYFKPYVEQFNMIENKSVFFTVNELDKTFSKVELVSGVEWKNIKPLRDSFNYVHSYENGVFSDVLSFNIELSDYLTTFHYNLIEFTKNKYTVKFVSAQGNEIIIRNLFPSFSLETSEDDGSLNIIQVTLRTQTDNDVSYSHIKVEEKPNTDKKHAASRDDNEEYSTPTITISGITFPTLECISPTMAKRLILPQTNIDGSETGKYYVLEGYESYFAPISDIIIGTYSEETINNFDVSLYVTTRQCIDSGCIYSIGLNKDNYILGNSELPSFVAHLSFPITSKGGWEIIDYPSCLSFSELSGEPNENYYVTITSTCGYGVNSVFKIKICDDVFEYNVKVVDLSQCFLSQEYYDNGVAKISSMNNIWVDASEHHLEIPFDKQNVSIVKVPDGIKATIVGSSLVIDIPKRTDTIYNDSLWFEGLDVQADDGSYCSLTIFQDHLWVYYKTEYNNFICEGTTKYYMKRLYSGLTYDGNFYPTDIVEKDEDSYELNSVDCIPDSMVRWQDTDDYYCEEGKPEPYQQWSASTEYTCDGYNKYAVEYLMISNDGVEWTATTETRQGELIESQSEDCGYCKPQFRRVDDLNKTVCNGKALYYQAYKEASYDCGETWERTGLIGLGNLISENTVDCGGTGCTVSGETQEKWEDSTDETLCDGLNLYYKAYKYTSCNNGLDWVKTDETRLGTLIKEDSEACGAEPEEYPQYKWEDSETDTVCYNGDLYKKSYRYIKESATSDWVLTGEEKLGTLIESGSEECKTCEYEEKWIQDSDTANTVCNGFDEYFPLFHYWSDDCWVTSHRIGDEYRIGELYKKDSEKCGYVKKEWRSEGFACGDEVPDDIIDEITYSAYTETIDECKGFDLYSIDTTHYLSGFDETLIEYSSTTEETLIEENSEHCGYVPSQICETIIYYNNGSTSVKTINGIINQHSGFSGRSDIKRVEIGNCVTTVGGSAFTNCYNLTSVTIPNSVTRIGEYAFRNCSILTSVIIPDSVTSIGTNAFYTCYSLTSVTIPNSVTSIGDYAFNICSGLTSIEIPNSVTRIGHYTFNQCRSLTSVTIPDSVTSIGDSAFYNCSGLTSITIPNSVPSIGYYAFYGCSSLTSITIPNSVTNIWDNAFGSCTRLTSINYNGTITQWNAISKGIDWKLNVPTSCVVHCTDGNINI